MEAVAKTKYLKGSPQKTRLVIDLVRGKNVSKALSILQFTNKRAAGPIAKCLRSAIANATYKAEQENIAIDPDDLWVKRCFVDMGPTKNRRRMRPAPQGRAYFERRHYCHITIELTSEPIVEPVEEAPRVKKGKKANAKTAEKPKTKKPENAAAKDAKPAEKVETEKLEGATEAAEPVKPAEDPVTEKTEEKKEAGADKAKKKEASETKAAEQPVTKTESTKDKEEVAPEKSDDSADSAGSKPVEEKEAKDDDKKADSTEKAEVTGKAESTKDKKDTE